MPAATIGRPTTKIIGIDEVLSMSSLNDYGLIAGGRAADAPRTSILLALSCESHQPESSSKRSRHENAKTALQVWLDAAKAARWNSLEDIRQTFPATDLVGPLAIFNIKGNSYRLIVRMMFSKQKIFIKEFLTHAEYSVVEYSKEGGKNGCDR